MYALCRGLLRQGSRRGSHRAAAAAAAAGHSASLHQHSHPHRTDAHFTTGSNATHPLRGTAEAQVVSSSPADGACDDAAEPLLHPRRRAAHQHSAVPPRPSPTRPLILEDVQDAFSLSPTQEVSGQQLWTGTRVLRSNKHVRYANGACVVGGASAIRRIWRAYGIRPNVVYVPNTESEVPAWCLEPAMPSIIVRCSPVAVKRQLLSAEYSDGYAAEFPLPPLCVTDAAALLGTTTAAAGAAESASPPDPNRPLHNPFHRHQVRAMLVLVGLRIPSNVGALLRAAAEMGYDAAVLVDCADPMQEKVLRASDGAALSPALRLYETDATEQSCVSLLSAIAAEHRLMPFLAVPSQEVDPAFEVAKRFHVYNSHCDEATAAAAASADVPPPSPSSASSGVRAPPPPRLGAMVVLGSEAQGLRALHGRWAVPYQLVTLPLPNPMVDSFNVSVAGSVLLHLFRPQAAEHFNRLVALSGETVADLLPATAAAENGEDADERESVEEDAQEDGDVSS